MSTDFSYRSARSGSFVVGISTAILIETVAMHLLLVRRHPYLATALTTLSLLAIAWLVRDYRALGVSTLTLDDTTLRLKVGRRFDLPVPRADVARVLQPTYKDLPTPGTNQGRDYLNLTKPAQPNVLIVLHSPAEVRLPAGMRRTVGRIALHLDDPAAFVARFATDNTTR